MPPFIPVESRPKSASGDFPTALRDDCVRRQNGLFFVFRIRRTLSALVTSFLSLLQRGIKPIVVHFSRRNTTIRCALCSPFCRDVRGGAVESASQAACVVGVEHCRYRVYVKNCVEHRTEVRRISFAERNLERFLSPNGDA